MSIFEDIVNGFNRDKSKLVERVENRITGGQLHRWYLDATKELDPDNYNEEAQKSYTDLNSEQKFIDDFIAAQINKTL